MTKKLSVIIVYGGCLARDVAEQIEALKPDDGDIEIDVTLRCASERPKTLIKYKTNLSSTNKDNDGNVEGDDGDGDTEKKKEEITTPADAVDTTTTIVCFVLQTIEHGLPTEEGGIALRFFKRKTHPEDFLSSEGTVLQYAVLGLGDSNLLLDRQTTGAKDCNQAAQQLETRLSALGGQPICALGLADERTGLDQEVEPWIREEFW
eukprot:CAMPEP_0170828330 /NCGR_PEP_ID=MMETSP0733-20121128/47844_1 /TAXON_ID=186038 /ORGANISM="Fragilariopsis kerguelensis, Strain L26-C5" /LENGTH=205 /DNA_ID=CAMNT_0011192767 /DNA_START=68 /DNA_END=682 /DNA_ORIENTATION=+